MYIPTSAVLQKSSGSEAADTKGAQNALYSLAVEYVPKLLSYMSHIKTSKAGGCGLQQILHPVAFSFPLTQKWVSCYWTSCAT